jgi:hypothetical protein
MHLFSATPNPCRETPHWAEGRYEETRALFERTLAILEQTPGPDHPDAAVVRSNLNNLPKADAVVP